MERYDLVPDGDEWKLRKKGAERSAMVFESKQEAVQESTEFMRNHSGSLRIHNHKGVIQEERTYPRSADPRKSPG
jgi:hypothetical protein